MTSKDAPPPGNEARSNPASTDDDPALETLRDILFSQYRLQLAELEKELDDLERRVTDEETLAAIVAPIIGDAIRRKIRDAREEMIEALYPIIGQTVVRSVQEAIRELARNIDSQMRSSLSPGAIGRRLVGRLRGVSSAEISLREALPFQVAEVFLIHRETGLLIWHISNTPDTSSDSDLISSMLTAIRDFVQDTFGHGKEGQLDEIQYGDRRILIEAAQFAYLAVVVDGIEPLGFRAEMRERIIEINNVYEHILRDYEGDPMPLAPTETTLRGLITSAKPSELSRGQKQVLATILSLILLCSVIICLSGVWAWGTMRATPTPTVTLTSTATNTALPTSTSTSTLTPTHTNTSTSTPTSTLTFTPSPTATPTPTHQPFFGSLLGNFRVREQPDIDSPRSGIILEQGQPVEILAVYGNWYLVRWTSRWQETVIGWVPSRWVGTTSAIPPHLVTPTPAP
jgi:hypothetical protein